MIRQMLKVEMSESVGIDKRRIFRIWNSGRPARQIIPVQWQTLRTNRRDAGFEGAAADLHADAGLVGQIVAQAKDGGLRVEHFGKQRQGLGRIAEGEQVVIPEFRASANEELAECSRAGSD